jgi:outer membrane biosynthesis protein TonB
MKSAALLLTWLAGTAHAWDADEAAGSFGRKQGNSLKLEDAASHPNSYQFPSEEEEARVEAARQAARQQEVHQESAAFALHVQPAGEAPTPPPPKPTPEPTPAKPTAEPTADPTKKPTAQPTEQPTAEPTPKATDTPTSVPTTASWTEKDRARFATTATAIGAAHTKLAAAAPKEKDGTPCHTVDGVAFCAIPSALPPTPGPDQYAAGSFPCGPADGSADLGFPHITFETTKGSFTVQVGCWHCTLPAVAALAAAPLTRARSHAFTR